MEKTISLPYIGSDIKHDVYFYFEHINNEKIFNQYKDYAEFQIDKDIFTNIYDYVNEGIVTFYNVVKEYQNKSFDIYVASTSSKSRKDESFNFIYDIEMLFCVMMKKDYPISTHMGISRNKYYTNEYCDSIFKKRDLIDENIKNLKELTDAINYTQKQINEYPAKKSIVCRVYIELLGILENYKKKYFEYKRHQNLSIYLHLFAIICSKKINEKLLYMYTKPAYTMFKILYKYFKDKNLIDTKKIIYFGDSASHQYINKMKTDEPLYYDIKSKYYDNAIFDSEFPFDSNIEGVKKIKDSNGLYGSIKWKLNETNEIIDYPPWINDILVPKAPLISIIIDVEQFVKFNKNQNFFDTTDGYKRKSKKKSKRKKSKRKKSKKK
jgi:hypothetical protein